MVAWAGILEPEGADGGRQEKGGAMAWSGCFQTRSLHAAVKGVTDGAAGGPRVS